jgi:glycerate kinase
MPLDVAIKKSRQYLQDAAERAARLIIVGQRIATGVPATATEGAAATAYVNGSAAPAQQVAKRNKPVKHFVRAKRIQGLTHAAVALSQRRRFKTLV